MNTKDDEDQEDFVHEVETCSQYGKVCVTVTHEILDEECQVSWNGARISVFNHGGHCDSGDVPNLNVFDRGVSGASQGDTEAAATAPNDIRNGANEVNKATSETSIDKNETQPRKSVESAKAKPSSAAEPESADDNAADEDANESADASAQSTTSHFVRVMVWFNAPWRWILKRSVKANVRSPTRATLRHTALYMPTSLCVAHANTVVTRFCSTVYI